MTKTWYAVRSVYEHGREADGNGVFCERVLLFEARSAEDAFDQAQQESVHYLELNPDFRRIGEWSTLRLSQRPESASEVWSMIYLDKRVADDFYREHYKALELPPDD